MQVADAGIDELQQFVDTLIVIPNQNLFRIANEKTTFSDAFKMADDVLHAREDRYLGDPVALRESATVLFNCFLRPTWTVTGSGASVRRFR